MKNIWEILLLGTMLIQLSWNVSARAIIIEPSDSTRYYKIDSATVSAYSFYENSISAFGTRLLGLKTLSLSKNVTLEQSLRLLPSIDIRERGGKKYTDRYLYSWWKF